jgi:hypothetical protein
MRRPRKNKDFRGLHVSGDRRGIRHPSGKSVVRLAKPAGAGPGPELRDVPRVIANHGLFMRHLRLSDRPVIEDAFLAGGARPWDQVGSTEYALGEQAAPADSTEAQWLDSRRSPPFVYRATRDMRVGDQHDRVPRLDTPSRRTRALIRQHQPVGVALEGDDHREDQTRRRGPAR